MAVEVGTAVVTLIPSAKGFSAAVRKELGDLEGGGAAAGDRAGSGFASGFTKHLSSIAKVGAVALAGLGTAAAGYGVKIASQNEQAQVSFETMLGSAEAAQAFLGDMKKFAASTPFEFPELQTAASSLISAGVAADKVIPIMTSLGDVTSGMGTGAEGVQRATIALQQMNAAGRITGEDLNQLRDAGVPVFDLLAAATGKTKEQLSALAQSGKLGRQELDQLMGALESGKGLERFTGLMEKQSQTLTGMISTLKDNLGQGLADALAPAMPAIKEALGGLAGTVAESMTTLGPALGLIVTTLADTLKTLLPIAAPILDSLGGLAATVIGGLLPVIQALTPHLVEFVRLIAFGLTEGLATVIPALGEILKALAPLLPVLGRLASTLLGVFAEALTHIAVALVPVVEVLVAAFVPVLDELIPMLPELVDAFMPLIPPLAELLVALAPLIAALLTLQSKALAKLLPVLIPVVTTVAEFAAMLLHEAVPAVTRIVDAILHLGDTLSGIDLSSIGTALGSLWATVTTWFTQTALPGLVSLLGTIGTWIVTTGIPALASAALGLAGALVSFVGQAVAQLPGALLGLLTALGSWILDTALPWLLEKMATLAVGMLLWIAKATIELPVHLVQFLIGFGRWLVTEAIPWVTEKVDELATALLSFIVTAIKNLPENLASFAKMLIDFIAGLPQQITDAAKNMFVGITNAFIVALNALIRLWNDFKLVIPEVEILGQKVGGFTMDTPDLPLISELKALAKGGTLRAGEAAIVGEAGPELFQARTAGRIIPNAALQNLGQPATGLQIGKIEVNGQDQPDATAFAITRELRRTAFFGGATYQPA